MASFSCAFGPTLLSELLRETTAPGDRGQWLPDAWRPVRVGELWPYVSYSIRPACTLSLHCGRQPSQRANISTRTPRGAEGRVADIALGEITWSPPHIWRHRSGHGPDPASAWPGRSSRPAVGTPLSPLLSRANAAAAQKGSPSQRARGLSEPV
jgi:hypothetical protein